MTRRTTRLLCLAALGSVVLPTLALTQDAGEKAVEARQGFMSVVVYEAGPLFGMAKGDIAYDAEAAATHAGNLAAITDYGFPHLFVDGTSMDELGDTTEALPAIWEKPEEFAEAWEALGTRASGVVEVAGDGQEALAAAVSELGKACGNCHDDFRKDDD